MKLAHGIVPVALFVASLAACNGMPRLGPASEARFVPAGPTIVAFTRPWDPLREERGPDDYASQIAALRAALEQLVRCTSIPTSAAHLLLVDRVAVSYQGQEDTLLGSEAPVVILMDANRPPQRIELTERAGAPNGNLRTTAAAYFDATGCQDNP